MIREMRCRDIKTGFVYPAIYSAKSDLTMIHMPYGLRTLNREQFNDRYRYTATGDPIKQAPWPADSGYKIHEGDNLKSPSSGHYFLVCFDEDSAEWLAVSAKTNATVLLKNLLLDAEVVVWRSAVKYTSNQRAAGMHKFKYKSKPKQFTHRTLRGG